MQYVALIGATYGMVEGARHCNVDVVISTHVTNRKNKKIIKPLVGAYMYYERWEFMHYIRLSFPDGRLFLQYIIDVDSLKWMVSPNVLFPLELK